jgi:lipid-A-disaccharide synthase
MLFDEPRVSKPWYAMSLRIGIIAGEASGDLLAADLMQAIRARVPDVQFEGVAGPLMQAAGCQVLYPAEKLAVMGLVEVLGHLPELLRMRRALRRHFLANPPDLFIGVDAPDFNLALERRLKGAGIPVVHYVSPSVWAWRQYRVRKIARSLDLMLTLFPFEAEFYRAHHVPVRFVGHPLADRIPDRCQRRAVRLALKLPERGRILALLPGSRRSEVSRLAEPFLGAALWLRRRLPDLQFIAPLATPATREIFEAARRRVAPDLPVTILDGQSREAMCAADAVLLASGTAALECMLLKRPMAVAYRLSPISYWVARRLLRVSHYALPNHLAARPLVPEFIQGDVTPENLGEALLGYLRDPESSRELVAEFTELHGRLRQDASSSAAEAVLELVKK